MDDIINVTCSEITSAVGFLYKIQSVILNQTLSGGCEQSWYSEDGHLIADPSDPLKLMDPATAVRSDHLVSSLCVNLNHEIICDSADRTHFSRVSSFRGERNSETPRNETAVTPNSDDVNEGSLQLSDQFWWWMCALFIIIIFIILMCFLLRKRIFRWFRRVVSSICERNDSENRVPESDVQMSFRSEDPRSVNQSESEQINGSMFRG